MENGVASLPNLSTNEEKPSVLHDDSPLRQTSQEPSSSHETAKSPDEEPSVLHDSTDELHANSLLSNSDDTIEDEFKPGPLRKFLEVEEMLNILEGPIFTLQEIPVGRKDGMYSIIDDTVNVERRKKNNQSQYWDDSGVWGYSSTPLTPFVFRNDKWRSLRLRRGIYCTLKYKNKQAEYIPLDPQPQPDDVVKLHRLYQKLQDKSSNEKKKKNTFQRRVTWLEKADSKLPAIPSAIAIVEYIGNYPRRGFHGNVKDKERNAPFVRTKPK